MLPELKEFKKDVKRWRLAAENEIFVCNQMDKLIEASIGKTWVPILDLPQKPIAVLCRYKPEDGEYFYFCSEFTLTNGWRDFPFVKDNDSVFDWMLMENVEALV